MRVTDRYRGAHHHQLVGEEQAVLEHLLVDDHRAGRLSGQRQCDAGQVRRECRPRAVLDLWHVIAGVVADHQLLVAGDDDVGAVDLAAQPQPLEYQSDHPQIGRHGVLDDQLAAGDAGQRHERPDLDVIGSDRMRAAAQTAGAVDGHYV